MCLERPLWGLRVMEEGLVWEAQEGGRAGERERQLGCPLVSCWGSDHTRGKWSPLLPPAHLVLGGRPPLPVEAPSLPLGGGRPLVSTGELFISPKPEPAALGENGRFLTSGVTMGLRAGGRVGEGSQGRDGGGGKGDQRHPKEVPAEQTACSLQLVKLCDVQ
ncbi:hypothetical protein H1C71_001041 [Ictidomys tridecemlineatus]|nr:hypothetical protein H1C71_001041 [Ictidomys tridecemlineatus]